MESSAVTREPGPARGRAYRRILVGFDGSREAQDALRTALALGEEVEADVRVLLVVRPPAHVETPEELASAVAAERENLSRGLSRVLPSGARPPVDTRVVIAEDPAQAIAEHAEQHGFDIVVVGSHGREHAMHRGTGRCLTALVRSHPCPVLVV